MPKKQQKSKNSDQKIGVAEIHLSKIGPVATENSIRFYGATYDSSESVANVLRWKCRRNESEPYELDRIFGRDTCSKHIEWKMNDVRDPRKILVQGKEGGAIL